MTWIAGLLVAGCAALFGEWAAKETQSWTPKLIRRFVGTAVRRLPEARRERLGEEWQACLSELPTPISQMLFAVGVRIAAERIRSRDRREGTSSHRSEVPGIGGVGGSAASVVAGAAMTYRLRGVSWFLGCVAIVLGFYLVSLQVNHARRQVEDLERSIIKAQREISALETKLAVRERGIVMRSGTGRASSAGAPSSFGSRTLPPL